MDTFPWHACVFCGKRKRTARCLPLCRARHTFYWWRGMAKMFITLNVKNSNSPWFKVLHEAREIFKVKIL